MLDDPSRPGPEKGYRSPAPTTAQPVVNNGRPREQARGGISLPRASKAGRAGVAPPLPPVNFKVPWYGMNNPNMPQPIAQPGVPSFNSFTGEWVKG